MLIDVESDLLSLDDVELDSLSLVEPLNDVDVLMESDLLVLIESLVDIDVLNESDSTITCGITY